jgi:hypothetical protein
MGTTLDDIFGSATDTGESAADKAKRIQKAASTMETALPNSPPVPNQRNEVFRQAPREVPSWRQTANDIIEPMVHYGPEIVGATMGGMRGAQLGTAIAPFLGPLAPVGPILGGIAGSAIGGTGGRVAGRGLAGTTGIMPLPSADETIREMQEAVPENLAGEGIGQILRGGAHLAGAAKRRMLRGSAPTPAQMQTFQEAGEHGITIRPADLTENPAASRVERMIRGTQGGSDIFRRTDMRNREALRTMLTEDMASQSATMSPAQRGEMIQSVLEGRQIPQYQEMARRNYDELRHITAGEKVVIPNESFALSQELARSLTADTNPKASGIVKQITELLSRPGQVTGLSVSRKSTELPGVERLTGINVRQTSKIEPPPLTTGLTVKGKYGEISPEAQAIEDLGGNAAEAPLIGLQVRRKSDQILPDITTGMKISRKYETLPGETKLTGLSVDTQSRAPVRPKPLDFSEAHQIRSMLGELGSTGETLPGKTQGIANNLWKMLGHEMEQGAITFQNKTGVPLLQKWKAADQFVKEEGHAVFDSAVIKGLLKANPEDVVRSTLKENGITEAQRVVKSLQSDPEALGIYRAGVTQELMRRATNPQTGELTGQAFFKQANMIGEEALKEIYGQRWPTVQKFLNIAKDMDPRTAAGQSMNLVDTGMLVWIPITSSLGAISSGSPYPIVASAGGAAAWLIGTHHIAKILNDPKKSGQLLRAMSLKPGTEGYLRAAGQLISTTVGEN